jgi:hypothetical protein
MKIYKHKNCRSLGVEVVKMIRIPDKPYARIKVRWWKLTNNKPVYCLNVEHWLTDRTIEGNKKERQKYPLEKWKNNWELLK